MNKVDLNEKCICSLGFIHISQIVNQDTGHKYIRISETSYDNSKHAYKIMERLIGAIDSSRIRKKDLEFDGWGIECKKKCVKDNKEICYYLQNSEEKKKHSL